MITEIDQHKTASSFLTLRFDMCACKGLFPNLFWGTNNHIGQIVVFYTQILKFYQPIMSAKNVVFNVICHIFVIGKCVVYGRIFGKV